MNFGATETRARRRLTRAPLRRASARVVSRSVPDAFADVVVSSRVRALTLVTPWVTDSSGGCAAFDRIIAWAVACDSRIHLLTRAPANNEVHLRAVQAVLAVGGRVTINPALHAKVFIAEFSNGGRAAIVGSANLTAGTYDLLETALLVTTGPGRRGPDLVDDLLRGPILQIANHVASTDL